MKKHPLSFFLHSFFYYLLYVGRFLKKKKRLGTKTEKDFRTIIKTFTAFGFKDAVQF